MIDFGHGIVLESLNDNCLSYYRMKRNEYSIWKWCRQNDLIDEISHKKWFEKQSNDPSIKMYQIIVKKDFGNMIAGVCGITDIDRINQRAEFSLYISPEHQRKGYAKSALKTLLSHGFMNQNLNVIWGETFDGNPAYDMFLKLGMKHEGTRRQFYYKEGRFIDAHLVSITKEEYLETPWKQQQSG